MLPSALVEVICDRPEICANCVSSGVATDEAMVSGLAPGNDAETEMVGKSTCGSGATGKKRKDHQADEENAAHQQRGRDRPADEWL